MSERNANGKAECTTNKHAYSSKTISIDSEIPIIINKNAWIIEYRQFMSKIYLQNPDIVSTGGAELITISAVYDPFATLAGIIHSQLFWLNVNHD